MIPFGGFRPRNRVVLTFVGATSITTDTATPSFASHAIGVASEDRIVVVAVMGRAGGACVLNSLTVGGVSAAILVHNTATVGMPTAIAAVLVKAGTTATIDVTWSAVSLRSRIAVYTLTGTGGKVAVHDMQTDNTGNTLSVSIAVPRNGAVLAAAEFLDGTNYGATAWTGAAEDSDASVESATTGVSTASASNHAGSTGLTVQAVATAASLGSAMAAASWAPA